MKININEADRDDLLLLPGVNAREADAILSERNSRANFLSLDEFMEFVARLGVPPHCYRRIAERVIVEPVVSATARVIDF